MKQLSLFPPADPDAERFDVRTTNAKQNPMVRLIGEYPGEKCKNCAHFVRKHVTKTFFKCALRRDTNGPGTDIRANWQACARFQKSDHQE